MEAVAKTVCSECDFTNHESAHTNLKITREFVENRINLVTTRHHTCICSRLVSMVAAEQLHFLAEFLNLRT